MNVVTRGDLDGLACTVFIGLMEERMWTKSGFRIRRTCKTARSR